MKTSKNTPPARATLQTETFTTELDSGAVVNVIRTVVTPLPPQIGETMAAAAAIDKHRRAGEDDGFDPREVGRAYATAMGEMIQVAQADRSPRVSWDIAIRRPKLGTADGFVEERLSLSHAEAKEVFSILGMLVQKGARPGVVGMP